MQSSSRGGATVRLLAIHTTEGIMRAADLRDWKSWPGSAHASADQYGTLLDGAGDGFVDYGRASWTLRNGNPVSDNLELCALAKWTRADWLARPKLIEGAAVWLARRKKARPYIPLVKLTPLQVKAGMSGVIGHVDWTQGMKDGSHWDPGPGFPWDVVLARANELAGGLGAPADSLPATPTPEDDMFDTTRDRSTIEGTKWAVDQIKEQTDRLLDEDRQTDLMEWGLFDPEQGLRVQVASLQGQLAGLVAAVQQLGTGGGSLDMAAVVAAADRAATKAAADALGGLADRLRPTTT